MKRRDERFEFEGRQELNFVEEEGDPGLPVLRGIADCDEEVRHVFGEVAGVGGSLLRIDVDSRGERAVRGDRERERLQHSGGAADAVGPLGTRSNAEERPPSQLRHAGAESLVLGDLGFDCDPSLVACALLERAEQHRLADATQPGDQQRLLGVTARKALEQHFECLEFGVAADEGGRPGTGVWRVRLRRGSMRRS